MGAGKIHLVPIDTVILQEQLFVPVTGPALIHYFGADLGLEKYRGFAHHLDDRFHPVVFFLGQKGRVFQNIFHQVPPAVGLFLQRFFINCIELGMLSDHI